MQHIVSVTLAAKLTESALKSSALLQSATYNTGRATKTTPRISDKAAMGPDGWPVTDPT